MNLLLVALNGKANQKTVEQVYMLSAGFGLNLSKVARSLAHFDKVIAGCDCCDE